MMVARQLAAAAGAAMSQRIPTAGVSSAATESQRWPSRRPISSSTAVVVLVEVPKSPWPPWPELADGRIAVGRARSGVGLGIRSGWAVAEKARPGRRQAAQTRTRLPTQSRGGTTFHIPVHESIISSPLRRAARDGAERAPPVGRCHSSARSGQPLLTVRNRSSVSGDGMRPVMLSRTTSAGGELLIGTAGRYLVIRSRLTCS